MISERIGALSEADRAALLDFWIAGWTATFPSIDFAAQREWLSGHLNALMADGAWLLVMRAPDHVPIAFLTVHPATGIVDQICVDPAHAGQGLASTLIGTAKDVSPGGLDLRVNKANQRAMAVYGRAGFVVTGEDVSARSGLPIWAMAWRPPV